MNKNLRREFVHSLLQAKSEKEMDAFLSGVLTPKEREELPKRLAVFALLKKDIPQHEIAEKIGVGIATVTRGSLELQRGQIQKTSWWRNLSSLGG